MRWIGSSRPSPTTPSEERETYPVLTNISQAFHSIKNGSLLFDLKSIFENCLIPVEIYCRYQAYGWLLFNTQRMRMASALHPLYRQQKVKSHWFPQPGKASPSSFMEKRINVGSEWRQRIWVPCGSVTRKRGKKHKEMSEVPQGETSWMESW